jgi:hypothetical protein
MMEKICEKAKILRLKTIADRLVYNSQIFILEGPSYRKRTKQTNP